MDESIPYDQLVPRLQDIENAKTAELSRQKIHFHSKLLQTYGKPESPHGHRFANLYTGGTLICTQKEWREVYLKLYANDVANGILMSMTETCPACLGIVCFFELDYRSVVRLPTTSELRRHLDILKQLLLDSFGPNEDFTIKVARCDPKLKYCGTDVLKPKLAFGLHIVCPYLIVTTKQLHQLILTLDARITSDNAFFSGVVDPSSVHQNCANLRLLYAYRMDSCTGCKDIRKPTQKPKITKSALAAREWNKNVSTRFEDEMHDESDSDTFDTQTLDKVQCLHQGCIDGRRLLCHSVYVPWLEIETNGNVIQIQEPDLMNAEDKVEWIEDMSIVPDITFPLSKYHPAKDAILMDEVYVRSQTNSNVFANEKKFMKAKTFRSDASSALYRKATELVQMFEERYSQTLAQSIHYEGHRGTLYINLKGNGARMCLLTNTVHHNRIYFACKLKGRHPHIAFRCHKRECQKKLTELLKTKHSSLSILELQLLGQLCKPMQESLFRDICDLVGVKPRHLPAPSMVFENRMSEDRMSEDRMSVLSVSSMSSLASNAPEQPKKTHSDDLNDFATLLKSFAR